MICVSLHIVALHNLSKKYKYLFCFIVLPKVVQPALFHRKYHWMNTYKHAINQSINHDKFLRCLVPMAQCQVPWTLILWPGLKLYDLKARVETGIYKWYFNGKGTDRISDRIAKDDSRKPHHTLSVLLIPAAAKNFMRQLATDDILDCLTKPSIAL